MKAAYENTKKFMDQEVEIAAAKRTALIRRLEGGSMRSLWEYAEQIVEIEVEGLMYSRVAKMFEREDVVAGLKSFKEDLIEKLLRGPEVSSTSMFSNAVGLAEFNAYRKFLGQLDLYIYKAEIIEAAG